MSYLDEVLHGLLRSDLILIGARTGAGKSTLANQFAYHNAQNGTKVSLFSLENYENEFELMEIFKECHKTYNSLKIDFTEFTAQIKMYPEEIISKAHETVQKNKKNINLVSRAPGGFNIENMKEKFVTHAKSGSQMFVIDHIDYLDMHNPKVNEKQILKTQLLNP